MVEERPSQIRYIIVNSKKIKVSCFNMVWSSVPCVFGSVVQYNSEILWGSIFNFVSYMIAYLVSFHGGQGKKGKLASV